MNVDTSKERQKNNKNKRILSGSVAYLGQKPWIMNSTVKENILLGREYNKDFFDKCLRYSALEDDLTHWEKGIDHMVGEGGVTLSGGQKARLAFARCLYQDPDIYLIDDVTSALDVHVGGMIFNKTIKEFLKNKTVVMTTHNIQFLKDADFIYYMDEGEILVKGNFDEIKTTELFKALEAQKGELSSKSNQAKEENQPSEPEGHEGDPKAEDETQGGSNPDQEEGEQVTKKYNIFEEKVSGSNLVDYFLTSEEDLQMQPVTYETYKTVAKELFGIKYLFIFALIIFISLLENQKEISLSKWSNKFTQMSTLRTFIIYNTISISAQLLSSGMQLISNEANERQSSKINSQMLYRVLHSNLEKFLDKIPKSTLRDKINRTWSVDQICNISKELLNLGSYTLIMILNISSHVGPLFLVCFGILVGHSFFGKKLSRKLLVNFEMFSHGPKRSKANYYSAVQDRLVPLKAMRLQGYLRKRYYGASESFANYSTVNTMNNVQKALQIELVHLFFFLIPSYLMLIFMRSEVRSEEVMVALFVQSLQTLTYKIRTVNRTIAWIFEAMQSFKMCMWFNLLDPEENLKSFEQDLKTYTNIKKKTLKRIEDDFGKVAEKNLVTKGVVEITQISAKYSIHENLILKDLNLRVEAGEKIGIVGRTGSGKSSLIKLLWRYLEPVKGSILVDGSDISGVDLKSYRSQISVVTQDTSLVYGTLRENLDPYNKLAGQDPKMVKYLRDLGFVNKEFLKDGLDMKVKGSGTNLSMGERQVLALARILLRPRKLIILDEATSSIDIKTEQFLQKEIEEKLKESTMLIIAHRLQTVMNCDRILVLKDGKAAAFDSPSTLMGIRKRVENGEKVDGAEGAKFFAEAIQELEG